MPCFMKYINIDSKDILNIIPKDDDKFPYNKLLNDKNRQEQLIDEEFKEQIESILSEYSAFGFDYDTIFNHMCNY